MIVVQDLVKRFGHTVAVDRVSFSIGKNFLRNDTGTPETPDEHRLQLPGAVSSSANASSDSSAPVVSLTPLLGTFRGHLPEHATESPVGSPGAQHKSLADLSISVDLNSLRVRPHSHPPVPVLSPIPSSPFSPNVRVGPEVGAGFAKKSPTLRVPPAPSG